jgi:hypothetical protein
MAQRLSSEDFMAGLLAALAKRKWGTLSIRGDRFDRASAQAYRRLREVAPERGIELRFYVKPHPNYGDSTTVRDAIARLAMWDLVSLDNPEYQDVRLKITPDFADSIFRRLSLDPELFDQLASTFVQAYEAPPAT